jgi:hypothetical protein
MDGKQFKRPADNAFSGNGGFKSVMLAPSSEITGRAKLADLMWLHRFWLRLDGLCESGRANAAADVEPQAFGLKKQRPRILRLADASAFSSLQ